MKISALFLLFLVASVPVIEATTPYYHAVQFGRTLRRLFSPRIPFGLKVLGVGKHLLLAPITVPLAVGAKMAGAGIIAGPAIAGAAIGAPVGAIAGAHAGKLSKLSIEAKTKINPSFHFFRCHHRSHQRSCTW